MENKQNKDGLSKHLRALRHDNPFTVPPNYFRNLTDDTWNRMEQQSLDTQGFRATLSGSEVLVRWLQQWWMPRLALTLAVLIGVMMTTFFWFRSGSDASPHPTLTEHEIIMYIEDNLDDFDTYELYGADILSMEDISDEDLIGKQSKKGDLDRMLDNLIEEIEIEDIL